MVAAKQPPISFLEWCWSSVTFSVPFPGLWTTIHCHSDFLLSGPKDACHLRCNEENQPDREYFPLNRLCTMFSVFRLFYIFFASRKRKMRQCVVRCGVVLCCAVSVYVWDGKSRKSAEVHFNKYYYNADLLYGVLWYMFRISTSAFVVFSAI